MIDHDAMISVLTDLAALLVRDYAVSDALHDLVDGVNLSLGITGSGVTLADGERIHFATAAPERIALLEDAQERAQAGPCVQAHQTGLPVLVTDIAAQHDGWPDLAAAATEAGIVAVAGIPMHLDGIRLGALNLYDAGPRDWSPDEIRAATLLAAVATACIANASRIDHLNNVNAQLQEALDGRVVIEQAKGILAGERHITLDRAFDLLRSHARANHASLRSVAGAVVELGLRP